MSVESLVRPNILALKPYSSARSEFKGKASIFLDANESAFNNGLNRYPDPLQQQLKAALSPIKGVPPANIFLGNGSDEVIDLLIRIFCEPKQDQIIILPPTYGMYQVSADISNVGIVRIPLTPDFHPKPKDILAAVSPHTKLLFLCTPNNPTGNSFNPEIVEEILQQFPGIVVIDEAYIDSASTPSYARWLERFPRLVIMQTFSKAWGLAAIRLGMAFASETIIQLMNKVKPPYNVNQLTQSTALEALQQHEQTQARIEHLLVARKTLAQRIAELPYVEKVFPSDANFLLVKMQSPNELYHYLTNKSIVVRNRSNLQLCNGCLRITIGTPTENKHLLLALAAYPSA